MERTVWFLVGELLVSWNETHSLTSDRTSVHQIIPTLQQDVCGAEHTLVKYLMSNIKIKDILDELKLISALFELNLQNIFPLKS